jgi:hypothetical protein
MQNCVLTCCNLITSAFFNIFIAQKDFVDYDKMCKQLSRLGNSTQISEGTAFTLCVAKRTRPNDPVPSVTPTSKSAKLIGVGKVRTSDMFYKNWIDRLRSDDISASDSGAKFDFASQEVRQNQLSNERLHFTVRDVQRCIATRRRSARSP